MTFKSLVEPVSSRPQSAFFGPAGPHGLLRDQFSIATWLAVGGLLEGALFLVAGRLALVPVIVLVCYKVADTWLVLSGFKKNPLMDKVHIGKFSAQIPTAQGDFSGKPADSEVVVFLIGTRNNHPLGMLAPNFKELGDYFVQMSKDLDEHADEFGFLGQTNWIASNQRTTQNELLSVCYFRTYDGLHRFAHSEHHRKGWKWLNSIIKQTPHLSIYHETYHVPSGHWETIYANSHAGHLASTSYSFTDKQTGEKKWASPVVDASTGLLKTSKGRMSRSNATEHDGYEPSGLLEVKS